MALLGNVRQFDRYALNDGWRIKTPSDDSSLYFEYVFIAHAIRQELHSPNVLRIGMWMSPISRTSCQTSERWIRCSRRFQGQKSGDGPNLICCFPGPRADRPVTARKTRTVPACSAVCSNSHTVRSGAPNQTRTRRGVPEGSGAVHSGTKSERSGCVSPLPGAFHLSAATSICSMQKPSSQPSIVIVRYFLFLGYS